MAARTSCTVVTYWRRLRSVAPPYANVDARGADGADGAHSLSFSLTHTQTVRSPLVRFSTREGDKTYTLLAVDADAPDPVARRLRERCHWLVYGTRALSLACVRIT
jgi:phosphatidylethanolamine-binding protein (PEBP) family uncharacterized protein